MEEERPRNDPASFRGKIFAEGRKLGTIRKDIAPDLIIEILVGATRAVAHPAKVQEMNLTPKAVLSAIITIILEGALTEKGRGTSMMHHETPLLAVTIRGVNVYATSWLWAFSWP